MIPLLLASLLAVQSPATQKSEWHDVDGMLFIINEDSLTKRDFVVRRARFMAKNQGLDAQRANKALQEEIKSNALGSQAGESMGIDASLVRRSVREYERRLIESQGGVDQYAAGLTQQGVTAEEMRGELEKQVYRDMWEDSRTGKGPNQEQKVIADRFVRPGTLRLTYGRIVHDPGAVTALGGRSSKVVLQVLEFDPVKVGGTSELEKAAGEVRARLVSGKSDFEVESASFALASGTPRPSEPLDEGSLAEQDPDLARLVGAAKEGDVLPVLPPHGSFHYWRVVRLVRREPGLVPAFKSAPVQKTIRKWIEERLDDRRLELARRQQLESSYIWIWPQAAR